MAQNETTPKCLIVSKFNAINELQHEDLELQHEDLEEIKDLLRKSLDRR